MAVKLSPPWCTFNSSLKALFDPDPDINVGVIYTPDGDDYDYAFNIEVKNHDKYLAFLRVMKPVIYFGNVSVRVLIQDMTDDEKGENIYVETFRTLFTGNPLLKDIKITRDFAGRENAFIRFQPEVLQFYNDDLQDYSGNWSGLAQDIARDVFGDETDPSIHFCTAEVTED